MKGLEKEWSCPGRTGRAEGRGCGGSQPVPAWGDSGMGSEATVHSAPVGRGAEALLSRGRMCRPFRSVPVGRGALREGCPRAVACQAGSGMVGREAFVSV